MASVKPRNAFTDVTDVWHAVVGFATSVVRRVLPHGWVASLVIAVVYVLYQSLQAEGRLGSYEDLVEFLVGFAVGEVVPV